MLILNGIQWGAAIGLGALSASLPLGLAVIIIRAAATAKTKEGLLTMPLFRPFPSRRWLKESLANAQREISETRKLATGRLLALTTATKRIALLEAQVATQAQTIADLDEEASGLRTRLADREGRLRDYRADKVARGLRWAAISAELISLREKNANQAELIRNFRSGALQEAVGSYRRAALHRFVSTLWASRRHYQNMPPCGVPGHVRGSWEDDVARIWWCPDCGDEMRMLS